MVTLTLAMKIAVNVALALVKQGFKVGLLDADVYGPSVPLMLDLSGALEQQDNMIVPKEKYGLRVMSLGMTADQNEAFIWRRPLVSKMIHQLLGHVKWGELDYALKQTKLQIKEFQLVRESKGMEATPSGWRSGKKALKPGVDLVGIVWKKWQTIMAFD